MELKKYMSEKDNLKAANRLLKFFVIVIGGATILNIFFTSNLVKNQKIIFIPPNISSQAFIATSDASDEYLVAIARYIGTLAFTYSPATARSQFDSLLKLFSPEVIPENKKIWYDLADRVEAGNISSAFYITKIEIFREKRELYLTGNLNQWTQDKNFITNEPRRYIISYRIDNGLFSINDIKELKEKE